MTPKGQIPTGAREKLIAAARDVLMEEGYAEATVHKISARAGVNHGLIHHYFVSKEHLLIEVMKSNPVLGNDEIPEGANEDEIIDYLMENLFSNARLHVQFHIMAAQMPELKEALTKLLDQKKQVIKMKFSLEKEEEINVLLASVTGLVLHFNLNPALNVKNSLRLLHSIFVKRDGY